MEPLDAEDGDAAAMFRTIGFSSFEPRPSAHKKRKYNRRADGAVADVSSRPSTATPAAVTTTRNADESDLVQVAHGSAAAQPSCGAPARNPAGRDPNLPQAPSGLPARPVSGAGSASPFGPIRGDGTGHDRKQPWYEDYYDPTSNQNPWERLEKSMRLLRLKS